MMIFLVVMMPVAFAAELNLTYDANGNLVTGDGKFRVYNTLNQLHKVYNGTSEAGTLIQEYTYDPVEERVLLKKTYNSTGQVTERVIYFTKTFVRVINTSGEFNFTYVYHGGQLVAQEVNSVKVYIHSDHLGSSSLVTNETGGVVENTFYSPYGEIISGGDETRFDYEGKEFSSVVGDYDFNFRKYNPKYAMFNQPDTLISNVYDPQMLNRYMFERGNPYKYTDPTGHIFGADDVVIIIYVALILFWGSLTLLLIDHYRSGGDRGNVAGPGGALPVAAQTKDRQGTRRNMRSDRH